MYKAIGLGLFGLFFMLVIPTGLESQQDNVLLYGTGAIVQKDASGEVILENVVHNRIVNTGEQFMMNATFRNASTDPTGTNNISAICLYRGSFSTIDSEGTTASNFDAANTITGTECQVEASNDVTTTPGEAIVNGTFAEPTHAAATDEIGAIGVCQDALARADGTDFFNCGGSGSILFSVFDITNVTLGSGGTVDITYTFNITSSGS
ncbi:MAG: hypothetical protein NPMRTH1_1250026 [Nitrosopumilales archaeon]|nr:MAG: hypothetical protein NPMRTH1_1250026 [Nitrosopumilales archaeon]